ALRQLGRPDGRRPRPRRRHGVRGHHERPARRLRRAGRRGPRRARGLAAKRVHRSVRGVARLTGRMGKTLVIAEKPSVGRDLQRGDVDVVANACDAGREGELIFAWTYEKAGAKKPVQRLWLSSMTLQAIKGAFEGLRPGSDFARLEEAARSRSEADWIVGMNS